MGEFRNFALSNRLYHNNTYMINAQDIKNGTCIRMDGSLYFCVEFLHVKPGKGNTLQHRREARRRARGASPLSVSLCRRRR